MSIPAQHEIGAFEAKNKLGTLLDWVEAGDEVLITRRGRPVARLVPIDQPASIHGSARILTKDESDLLSTGETWSAEQ